MMSPAAAHNMDLGLEAGANHTLALLRGLSAQGKILPSEPLLPGLFFSLDPESDTSGTFVSRPKEMIEATFSTSRPGRWLGLHLAIGGADLGQSIAFGVVCKSSAPLAIPFRLCLRSGTAEGFTDTFLRKTVLAHAAPSLHLDALMLEDQPALPRAAPWRELILFLQPDTERIRLHDLRLFIL